MIDEARSSEPVSPRRLQDEGVAWVTTVTTSGGEYLEKYRSNIDRTGMSLEAFSKRFSVPVRIRFYRLYGH